MKLFHFSGVSSSAKIASTGQAGTQAPQSMHSSGWMNSCCADSKSGSSFRGWMQSTGQTSTHAVSFVPTQGSVMIYATQFSWSGSRRRGGAGADLAGAAFASPTGAARSITRRSRLTRKLVGAVLLCLAGRVVAAQAPPGDWHEAREYLPLFAPAGAGAGAAPTFRAPPHPPTRATADHRA